LYDVICAVILFLNDCQIPRKLKCNIDDLEAIHFFRILKCRIYFHRLMKSKTVKLIKIIINEGMHADFKGHGLRKKLQ